jgi:hypothetical protein
MLLAKRFDVPLDPSETLTIRRVLTPDRIPNKGKAAYRFDAWLWPFLQENGWGIIGQNRRNQAIAYFRSPGEEVAESFVIHAGIPDDHPILRLAKAAMEWCARERPFLQHLYEGSIGPYRANYFPDGERSIRGDGHGEESVRRDRSPSLYIGKVGIWSTRVYWPDGLDQPPTWDRSEYFSAIAPGVPYCVELIERAWKGG